MSKGVRREVSGSVHPNQFSHHMILTGKHVLPVSGHGEERSFVVKALYDLAAVCFSSGGYA